MAQAPGWYADDNDPHTTRHWDGAAYTSERVWDGAAWIDQASTPTSAPVDALPEPQSTPTPTPTKRKLYLIVGAIVVVLVAALAFSFAGSSGDSSPHSWTKAQESSQVRKCDGQITTLSHDNCECLVKYIEARYAYAEQKKINGSRAAAIVKAGLKDCGVL